jgi:hypothetical protein
MASTTIPMTTMSTPTPTPTNTSLQSCSTPLKYEDVRKNKLTSITEYYNTLLTQYTTLYTQYSKDRTSTNKSDKDNAELILKPKIAEYNKQLINLMQTLMDTNNKDVDLILLQKNELDTKSSSNESIISDIKILTNKNADLDATKKVQDDNVNSTKLGTEDLHFTTQIYMGINILLILLIIGLIMYLVFTKLPSNSNSGNSNKVNNLQNIHSSIKVNTVQ